jgi:alkanesulfonate monooxygenase
MLPKAGEVSLDAPQSSPATARYRREALLRASPAACPDMDGWTRFARRAEESGIDSVLIALNSHEPDPLVVSCALGQVTRNLKFIVAYRAGLVQPTSFVHQINTLSTLIQGRVAVNLIADDSLAEHRGYGDFLDHDAQAERNHEFLTICSAFWGNGGSEVSFEGRHYQVEKAKLHTPFLAQDRQAPEIYVSGDSTGAERLALAGSACLLRVADNPQKLRSWTGALRSQGIEVGLKLSVICRPTRAEAVSVAQSLSPQVNQATAQTVAHKGDSQISREASAKKSSENGWLTQSLWAGLHPHYGSEQTALVGTPEDIACALLEYETIGVTQFIMSGWPAIDELTNFGRHVLPLVREGEEKLKTLAANWSGDN